MKLFCHFILLLNLVSVFSCAGNRKGIDEVTEIDGIIYFKKDVPGDVKKADNKSEQKKLARIKKKRKAESSKKRILKNEEGITYLFLDNQVNELPNKQQKSNKYTERGKASYYDEQFHGRKQPAAKFITNIN